MDHKAIWEVIKTKVEKATLYYADTLSHRDIHMLVTTADNNGVDAAAVELETWANAEIKKVNCLSRDKLEDLVISLTSAILQKSLANPTAEERYLDID